MIDVIDEINAVTRKVGTRVLAAGEARSVTVSRTYATDLDDLWDACTNPERIPRWFLPVSGDLRIGGRYQLEGNAGGVVEECDPPHRFAATWEFGDQISRIEVRLTEDPDGRTRFELEHTVPVDEHWDLYGPGAVGVGWDLTLIGLGLHLASGGPVDRDEFATWSASFEGLDFMRQSSEAWCGADTAGGTPPAAAEASARRTAAAYTGSPEDGEPQG